MVYFVVMFVHIVKILNLRNIFLFPDILYLFTMKQMLIKKCMSYMSNPFKFKQMNLHENVNVFQSLNN